MTCEQERKFPEHPRYRESFTNVKTRNGAGLIRHQIYLLQCAIQQINKTLLIELHRIQPGGTITKTKCGSYLPIDLGWRNRANIVENNLVAERLRNDFLQWLVRTCPDLVHPEKDRVVAANGFKKIDKRIKRRGIHGFLKPV